MLTANKPTVEITVFNDVSEYLKTRVYYVYMTSNDRRNYTANLIQNEQEGKVKQTCEEGRMTKPVHDQGAKSTVARWPMATTILDVIMGT